MAAFLGLPQTKATKLFEFLNGADTRYMSVLEWLERLSATEKEFSSMDFPVMRRIGFNSPALKVEGEDSDADVGAAILGLTYKLEKISDNEIFCWFDLDINSESGLVYIKAGYVGLFEVDQMPGFDVDSDEARELGVYCVSRIMPYVHELARDISRRFPRAISAELSIFRASPADLLKIFSNAKVKAATRGKKLPAKKAQK